MIPNGGRIGIVAGSGYLPLHVAKRLSSLGEKIYVAGLQGAADPSLDRPEWETAWYDVYSLGILMEGLVQAGVRKVVLAGRVGHEEIYRTSEFDEVLKDLLCNLKDHRPATILGGMVDLFTKHGFEVLPLIEVAPDLLPVTGRLAGPPVKPGQIRDIQLGWRIARIIADQDIGQAVVVKDGAVVAVEAMEGTDKTIERALRVSGGDITVVKLAASHHDFRYDVPTVGPDTISRLGDAGSSLIAVEAGRCFLLDPDQISTLCADSGITLISASETSDGVVNWSDV